MTAPPESAASFVTHLECSQTGEHHPAGVLHGLSKAGAPLLVRYDLDALAAAVDKDTISRRPPDMWRYREFLPLGPGGSAGKPRRKHDAEAYRPNPNNWATCRNKSSKCLIAASRLTAVCKSERVY